MHNRKLILSTLVQLFWLEGQESCYFLNPTLTVIFCIYFFLELFSAGLTSSSVVRSPPTIALNLVDQKPYSWLYTFIDIMTNHSLKIKLHPFRGSERERLDPLERGSTLEVFPLGSIDFRGALPIQWKIIPINIWFPTYIPYIFNKLSI